jgi:glucokinase
MSDYAIGVDLGGTNLRAAAVSRDGKMLNKVSGSTPGGAGRSAVIGDIVNSIETLQAGLPGQTLAGVGVEVPGFILMDQGIVVGAPNLPAFDNYPVRDEIEKLLGAKVILENDANAAALGEKWIGAGREVNDLILLTLAQASAAASSWRGKVLRGYLEWQPRLATPPTRPTATLRMRQHWLR